MTQVNLRKVNKLLDDTKATIEPMEFIRIFTEYVDQWQELDNQYANIPEWRIFKQLSNIRKREKLTRLFTARMKKYGVIK